ncbi:hypothetical protein LXL04_011210 [Taraxacum kok-saghyz]
MKSITNPTPNRQNRTYLLAAASEALCEFAIPPACACDSMELAAMESSKKKKSIDYRKKKKPIDNRLQKVINRLKEEEEVEELTLSIDYRKKKKKTGGRRSCVAVLSTTHEGYFRLVGLKDRAKHGPCTLVENNTWLSKNKTLSSIYYILDILKAVLSTAQYHHRERERERESFDNSYIPENPITPKPLTFSKNRLRGAKNRSNTSPVAKKNSEKTIFFSKTLHMCKNKIFTYVHIFLFCLKNAQIPKKIKFFIGSGSFEISYIFENSQNFNFFEKPTSGAKNHSNTSTVAKNFFRKNENYFFKNFAYGGPNENKLLKRERETTVRP